jgi:hypothetical protein
MRLWLAAAVVLALLPTGTLVGEEASPSPVAENAFQPAVTCDKNGTVYLVFGQGAQDARQIMLSISKDGGRTFGQAERVSVDAVACFASMERGPRVAVLDDGALAITCFAKLAKGGESHLYCYRKGAREKAFRSVRVSIGAKDAESMHDMCVDGKGNLHVVWQDSRSGKGNAPWYAQSTDGGKSFKGELATVETRDGVCPCCCPSIFASSDGKTVVIQFRNKLRGKDGAEYNDMYAAVSQNGGKRFDPAYRLDSRERWKG